MKNIVITYRAISLGLLFWCLAPFILSAQPHRYLLLIKKKNIDVNVLFPEQIFVDVSPVLSTSLDKEDNTLKINQQLYGLRIISFSESKGCFSEELGINALMSCCMLDSIFSPLTTSVEKYMQITKDMTEKEIDSLDRYYRLLYQDALKSKQKIIKKAYLRNQIQTSYKGFPFEVYLYRYEADVCNCVAVYWSNDGTKYVDTGFITKVRDWEVASPQETELFQKHIIELFNLPRVRYLIDSFLE